MNDRISDFLEIIAYMVFSSVIVLCACFFVPYALVKGTCYADPQRCQHLKSCVK